MVRKKSVKIIVVPCEKGSKVGSLRYFKKVHVHYMSDTALKNNSGNSFDADIQTIKVGFPVRFFRFLPIHSALRFLY